MKKITKISLSILLAASASSVFAAYNAEASGFTVNLSGGINQSRTSSGTETFSYGTGNTTTASIPRFQSSGGSLNLGVGYQFAFGKTDTTSPKFFFGPELSYSIASNVPISSQASFDGSGNQLSVTQQNSSINDLSVNAFAGMYFTPHLYARLSGGMGGFTSASSGMSGYSFNVGARVGYNISQHLSLYAEYKATDYLNLSGILANNVVNAVTFGFANSVVPAEAIVQSESIGIQYLF